MNRPPPPLDRSVPNVWFVRLDEAPISSIQGSNILPFHELERAQKFVREEDRLRHIKTRRIVRELLGAWINCAPLEVPIVAGEHGRPVLNPRSAPGQTAFSVSHSGDCAFIGIADRRRVGVDLEVERDVPELVSIAQQNFTDREYHALMLCPAIRKLPFFHAIWTRKEACLKAIGKGIPGGLDRFDVLPANTIELSHGEFMQTTSRRGAPDALQVGTLDVLANYSASVAYDGKLAPIRVHTHADFQSRFEQSRMA